MTEADALPSHEDRAVYGKRILVTLSRESSADCGRGFGRTELMRIAEAYPGVAIVVTPSQQSSGSHFHALPPIDALRVRACRKPQGLVDGFSFRAGSP